MPRQRRSIRTVELLPADAERLTELGRHLPGCAAGGRPSVIQWLLRALPPDPKTAADFIAAHVLRQAARSQGGTEEGGT